MGQNWLLNALTRLPASLSLFPSPSSLYLLSSSLLACLYPVRLSHLCVCLFVRPLYRRRHTSSTQLALTCTLSFLS